MDLISQSSVDSKRKRQMAALVEARKGAVGSQIVHVHRSALGFANLGMNMLLVVSLPLTSDVPVYPSIEQYGVFEH